MISLLHLVSIEALNFSSPSPLFGANSCRAKYSMGASESMELVIYRLVRSHPGTLDSKSTCSSLYHLSSSSLPFSSFSLIHNAAITFPLPSFSTFSSSLNCELLLSSTKSYNLLSTVICFIMSTSLWLLAGGSRRRKYVSLVSSAISVISYRAIHSGFSSEGGTSLAR